MKKIVLTVAVAVGLPFAIVALTLAVTFGVLVGAGNTVRHIWSE